MKNNVLKINKYVENLEISKYRLIKHSSFDDSISNHLFTLLENKFAYQNQNQQLTQSFIGD
jgi:hypothetical protein